jgi:ATP phosphoribosyltransferase regulatory subunit HisZ
MLAKTRQAVSMTTGARKVWESVYPKLSEGHDGLLGSATARAEAQCLRLALLYALLDEQPEIDVAHVLAGIAVWEYCDATARFVFGDAIGDRVADDIRRALLRSWDTGMSRTDIRNLFNRYESGERIEQALDLLDKRGQVRRERRNTEDIWYAGGATEATYATKAGRA